MVKPTGCANEIGFVWPDVNGHKTCNTYERSNTHTHKKHTTVQFHPHTSIIISAALSSAFTLPPSVLCLPPVCMFYSARRLLVRLSFARLSFGEFVCVYGFVFVLCTQYNMYIQHRIIHVSCRLYNISILVCILCATFLPNIFLVEFLWINWCID